MGEGEEEVRDPHQEGVELAGGHAREGADEDADDDGDEHRRDADREGDAAAVDHAGQQVLAEVVGAEGVLGGGGGELGGEVDVVDGDVP